MAQTKKQFSQDTEQISRQVWEIVDALPQRGAITEGDARHWVAEVVGVYGELAKWHATRAGGFGGSQIGALVRNFHGQRADHEASARKIVAGALLREVPEESNGHMRRGIAMEPSHREWFLQKYGAHRDVKGFEVLSKSTGARPWMRYSPDELAFMPNPTVTGDDTLQRWLGDYKAPGEVESAAKVSFQYVAQLHMGRMVCQHNGVEIHGMILSQFDWRNWALKDDVIPYMPEMDTMIVQAGDHYWDYVLRGQLPNFVRKPLLESAKEVGDLIADEAYRLGRLKAMAKIFDDEAEAVKSGIVEKISAYRFGSSAMVAANSVKISAVQVFDPEAVRAAVPAEVLDAVPVKKSSSSKYDVDKLVERVRETLSQGEKMAKFYAPGNLESEPLYQALLNAGFDADALMKEQLRVGTTPSVASEVRSFVEREFPGLIKPLVKESEPVSLDAGSQENREGQHESRHVPRLITA